MATLLARLGTTAYRRWPFFIAAWVVVLAVIIGLAAAFSKPMSDNFTIPGIPSEQAADLQAELFPGATSAFDQAKGGRRCVRYRPRRRPPAARWSRPAPTPRPSRR